MSSYTSIRRGNETTVHEPGELDEFIINEVKSGINKSDFDKPSSPHEIEVSFSFLLIVQKKE